MLMLVFETQQERDKFVVLYEKYGKTIYYTLKRFNLDEYTIEDLSQEVYIILANHLDDIDMKDSKKTQNYIITITRNYCLNYLRRQNRYHKESLEEQFHLHTDAEEPLEYIINKEQIHQLSQEIQKLDDIYKTVLELKYLNGFKDEEIASVLHIKKKTVEMRLYRAKIMLRLQLGEHKDV